MTVLTESRTDELVDMTMFWCGGRNSYLSQSGEYELSGGWAFTHQYDKHLEAELRVHETAKRRVKSYSVLLKYGAARFNVYYGKCRSVKEAKQQGRTLLKADKAPFRKLASLAFDPSSAFLLYRRTRDGYEPFCTVMGCFDGWLLSAVVGLPNGDYIRRTSSGNLRSYHLRGYESSQPASDDEVQCFAASVQS